MITHGPNGHIKKKYCYGILIQFLVCRQRRRNLFSCLILKNRSQLTPKYMQVYVFVRGRDRERQKGERERTKERGNEMLRHQLFLVLFGTISANSFALGPLDRHLRPPSELFVGKSGAIQSFGVLCAAQCRVNVDKPENLPVITVDKITGYKRFGFYRLFLLFFLFFFFFFLCMWMQGSTVIMLFFSIICFRFCCDFIRNKGKFEATKIRILKIREAFEMSWYMTRNVGLESLMRTRRSEGQIGQILR